ncbi:PREDICTED: pentatricopeptide repeat-containing protein At5g15280 [Nicotiana attenuata]|uniref:Pentatricopeptide repeat-containing protein n=1 Tax=Nicotiana attenuata TaxID=49451 RepID=A0A1J6J8L8_NICAT|nr:PREDICTED: pentatricopeptide repeat-containing protein At5g15280 [Nicotiana attenuata]OIT06143.1 pentatricopeptide repeat-containing protein [Nicotiana attenuata]
MLQPLRGFRKHKTHIKQVASLLFQLSSFPIRVQEFQQHTTKATYISQDLSSAIFSGVEKSVNSGSLSLLSNKGKILHNPFIKDCLFRLSEISPATARRFWRVTVLNPHDVLEILLGFQNDSGNFEVEVKKIESLWGIYWWTSEQSSNFKHLPKASEIIASMLVRAGLFKEVECLVSLLDSQGTFLDNHEIYSNLIEVFVCDHRLEKAITCYDRMRMHGLSPSMSCYRVLLDFLIQINETQLAFQIYTDAVDIGLGRSVSEGGIYEGVIRLLCAAAKVQDARNLVKKALDFGIEPNHLVLNSVASGYCGKRDYDDLLSFFVDISCKPDATVVNKLIHSVCGQFGFVSGNSYVLKLDQLGFSMNEITFGILIGWACREGKLKDAFFYLSEILSINLKPHIYSYDAILSGLFKEGMWKHYRDILLEMDDQEVEPQLSTFRVLLAGFCKARQFDEVNIVVSKMVDRGLYQLSPTEDPLSGAFRFLGLNSSAVKIRRDNDTRFHKAEFFDNLGNGLYLDTDLEQYERAIDKVLNDAMLPDFNSFVWDDYMKKDMKDAVMMVDQITRWGQEISLGALDALVKGLCASNICIKTISDLLEKAPNLTCKLDREILNKLVQKYSKKGYLHRARAILHGMLGRHIRLDSETHTALLTGLCKKGDMRGLTAYWNLAQNNNWLPDLEGGKELFGRLCRRRRLNESLELFKTLLSLYPNEVSDAFHVFLEKLSAEGFSSTAKVLAKEILSQGSILSHSAHSHLILQFCKWRSFCEAAVLCDSMLAKDWIPPLDASVQLIPQLCRSANSDKAVALKDICLRDQPSAVLPLHGALIHGFFKSGRIREAISLFQETLAKDLFLSVEIYDVLFQGYCQAKKRKKVEELLGVVIRKNLGISVASYRNIVRLMCTEGKVSTALCLKEHMLKQSNPPTAVIYNILIYSLFSVNETSVVNTLVYELLGIGLQLDEVTYNYLVQGLCWCKDLSSATQYLKTMMEKDLRPSNRSLREVIKCLCCYGELEEALSLSKEMEFKGRNHGSVIQINIVETLLSQGKLREAINFLDRMAIKGLIPENIDYNYLIKRLCQHGRVDKSVDLMDIMLRKGNVPESSSFDYVIQNFCTWRKLDVALNFHAEMLCRNQRPSINTWSILIKSLSEGGQVEEAGKQLDSMIQLGEIPSRETYSLLINMYRSQNNLNKASELLRSMQRCGYEPDFETHWSLINNLRDSSDNINNGKQNGGFLSRFLSEVGFARKNKGG